MDLNVCTKFERLVGLGCHPICTPHEAEIGVKA